MYLSRLGYSQSISYNNNIIIKIKSMTKDNPSLEDLLGKRNSTPIGSPTKPSDETAQDKLTKTIMDIGGAGKERETAAQAAAISTPYIDLCSTPLDKEALLLMSRNDIEQLGAVVFLNQNGQMRMGAVNADESVENKLAELAKAYNARGQLYLISRASLQKALAEYDKIPKKVKINRDVNITAEDLDRYKDDVEDLSSLSAKLSDIPLTDVMTIILAAAIKAQASDIHIEAEETGIKMRFRLDGILRDMAQLEKNIWPQVVARIKLIARLKINITDKPQDGGFTIKLPDDKLDIRVSALPTAFGESVVMRLLRSSSVGLKFEDLGLRGKTQEDLKREVERPNGMILTTGPTGSGKTTTLYAILNKLNDSKTKIITLEDPVEYKLEGVNQSQIDQSRDYTFAKGLRSILRQDPDVVMVGEIRDLETADTAINAALTGHLVLSTLHTNDASGAIPRFLSMGVKPFLLAPSVNAIIGQRLVRKLCSVCKKETALEPAMMERVKKAIADIPANSGFSVEPSRELKFYAASGCDKCTDGYKGRIGIYEVFTMTPAIEKLINNPNLGENDVKMAAHEDGMISMGQDGLLKALDGITSVDEVFRVAE